MTQSLVTTAFATAVSTTATVTWSPTATGDLVVVSVLTLTGLPGPISGGGVTTWHSDSRVVDSLDGYGLFWGVVTSTGSSTITVGLSHSNRWAITAQQFNTTVTGGAWTLDDGAYVPLASLPPASTSVYDAAGPFLTVDHVVVGAGVYDNATGGSTASFVYNNVGLSVPFDYGQFIYGVNILYTGINNCVWTQSSSGNYGNTTGAFAYNVPVTMQIVMLP